MAKQGFQNTSSVKANVPYKGMIKDTNDSYYPEGTWSHAVNATNYTKEGEIGTISNENGNLFCAAAPYTVIGRIYLFDQKWIIFSTNSLDRHEIGLFDEDQCTYCGIVRDPCLNFDKFNLITGVSKKNFDCTWQIYFADSKNPDRSVNIGNPDTWDCPGQPANTAPVLGYNWSGVAYMQDCIESPPTDANSGIGCVICTDKVDLDCNKIRLARLIQTPCVTINKGLAGGSMPNGSYYVVVAYSINQQRVTDYFTPSNVQPIFSHQNIAGSLDITIENLDTQFFEEFELVVVSTISQQTVAKQVGFYSTNTGSITLDSIDLTTPSVPLEQIPLRSPVYETSKAISQVSDYMLRIGPKTRLDFNYQPLANKISTRWVAVEYPTNYYRNGGSNTSYLRDEVYAFWIRWVYETGEKSASYHIPGRPPEFDVSDNLRCAPNDTDPVAGGNQPFGDLTNAPVNDDNIEVQFPDPNDYTPKYFEVYNTAYVTDLVNEPQEDGGIIVARGKMGYWQSTETYPNKPDVWNSSTYQWSNSKCDNTVEVDLCGEYIRHHKMPDNKCVPHIKSYADALGTGIYPDTEKIVVLGVEFQNIKHPVDNDGTGIPGIVGYEILRGSREGNKSIIAKGIFNNIRENEMDSPDYPNPQNPIRRKGLYQNYPYNPLGTDPSLLEYEAYPGGDGSGSFPVNTTTYKYNRVKTDMYTFHSPDTTFREPFLAETEVKLYGEVFGDVFGNFDTVPNHPKHKVITDAALIAAMFGGIGIASMAIQGKRTIRRKSGYAFNLGDIDFDNVNQSTSIGTWNINIPPAGAGTISQMTDGNVNWNGTASVPEDNGASQQTLTTDNDQSTDTFLGNTGELDLVSAIMNPSNAANTLQNNYLNNSNTSNLRGYIGASYDVDHEGSAYQFAKGSPLGSLANFATFTYYWVEGADSILKLIEAVITYEQYALMYTSHGNYSVFDPGLVCQPGSQRRMITSLYYLDNNIQNIVKATTNERFIINNLNRNKCVVVELRAGILPLNKLKPGFINTDHKTVGTCLYSAPVEIIKADNTVQTLNTVSRQQTYSIGNEADPLGRPVGPLNTAAIANWYKNPSSQFRTNTVCPYGALKYRNRNQYGQLELVRQVPASACVHNITPLTTAQLGTLCSVDAEKYNSGLIFGGDTYIGRYTEKNKFFYFSEWLQNFPDGTPLDYTLYYMVKYAKYWGDFTGFDLSTFINDLMSGGVITTPTNQTVPSDFHNFDRCLNPMEGLFNVMHAYFYLFQCGVRDFYVESEINVDLRDWGNESSERFYDPYKFSDLKTLFDPSIIKYDNYYKYDYSLSVSRIYNNFISWGNMQPRYYDPTVAELCYTSYPNRTLYSLPAQLESVKDNWYAFLANNYKDFTSPITAIKNIGKNGAGIFFKNQSPVMFQGVDTLETDLGTKITIGDGGLFSQPLQNLSNADSSYEYGACQDSMSILNTPVGIFYISAAHGKIFKSDGNSLIPISDQSMKWWFSTFLPFYLLQDFPTFEETDNPVAGIGCQAIYDNIGSILYFCKKDYRLKPEYKGQLRYISHTSFNYQGSPVELGDAVFFDDASWTISYDPNANDGNGAWISFHDWHPNHNIPSRNYFFTVINSTPWLAEDRHNGFWKHNFRTDRFNHYYDYNYRFELEFAAGTGQVVNTLRSIEYQMECFIYEQVMQYDKYNVLDYNFDNAIIYNIEQVSGVLNLKLKPKNDILSNLSYPIINLDSIDILYDKEEQKYRFNQFWDITDDRGEFTYPIVQRQIWNTQPNGYDMILNVNNLNYAKDPFQHKKFRHYTNFVKLYTAVNQNNIQNINMLFKFIANKNLLSPR